MFGSEPEHRIAVGQVVDRHGLDDIPMLHRLAILEAEQVVEGVGGAHALFAVVGEKSLEGAEGGCFLILAVASGRLG